MAIPKHVFNILNQNIDLVFSNRLTAKHLIELAIPCQAHGDDILSINQCLNPYCGKRIKNQRQAYYYLSQFKIDHPYAQVSKPFNSSVIDSEFLHKLVTRSYDRHGFILPFNQNFKEKKKTSDQEFYIFMADILNTDGFKNSGELYQRFIQKFSHKYEVNRDKPRSTKYSVQNKYEMVEGNFYISRKTFNCYLRSFFEQNKTQMSQFKYKILKSPNTKIGYYTRKNRTKKIISSEISK